jgi:rhamnulokinase
MATSRFLAFDLGAESGRGIVGTLESDRMSLQEVHRFANPNGRMLGHLHWNLLAQWEELKTGLRKAVAATDGPLSGIGIDTWGLDFGLVDRTGQILGNPFMYRDSRTDGMMQRVFQRVPREEVFAATGVQFIQINTIYQLMAMKEAGSPLLEVAERLLFIPDLFNYLFTGIQKSEFSFATTSQLYDPARRRWAVELMDRLGLPSRIMPEVVPSGTVLGPISNDVAEECGTRPLPLIAPATHDTGSAVAAVPAEGEGWCYISSGTWSLMGVELPSPVINQKTLRYNYTNEGGVGFSIRLLKNIMGLWLVQECRRQWQREGQEHSYAELTRMAESAPAFKAVIDPDHAPFLGPGQMPAKIEEFCRRTKQPPPADKGQFVRTCLESLALAYRRTLEGLEDVIGRRIERIHIVGGGGQNRLLNQMTADACGRQVLVGPVEATAMGNLLVQAMAVGQVESLAEIRAIVRNSFPVERYEPRDSAQWQKAYERFRTVVEA